MQDVIAQMHPGTVNGETRQSSAQPLPSSLLLEGTGLFFGVYVLLLAIEYAGLAGLIPILKVIRFSTLTAWGLTLVLLIRTGPGPLTESRQGRILLFLTVFGAASVLWAVVRSYVPGTFRYMLDYLALFYLTARLVDRPARVRIVAIVGTFVVLFTVLRNTGALLSASAAGRMVRFTAAYFMGDGNDMGWGLAMLLTFPVFLMLGKNGVFLRLLGMGGALAAIFAIVLTQSRGATLALAAGFLYYAVVLSKRRTLALSMVAVAAVGVWVLAPSDYRNRMETISSYEEDTSAQARIRAWTAATKMAVHYPLGVGIGNFSSAYGRYYRPDNLEGFGANRWISAHSVYFKILGEQGFLGLILLLIVLLKNLRDCQFVLRRIRESSGQLAVPELWPAALSLGLVGYSVGGMFLGGVTYPHLFLISGLIVACRRMIDAVPVTVSDVRPIARAGAMGPLAVRPATHARPAHVTRSAAVSSARPSRASRQPGTPVRHGQR